MKLINLGTGMFRWIDNASSVEGNWGFMRAHLVHELCIEAEEVDFAIETMRALGHDTGYFGVSHTFTHSSDTRVTNNLLSHLIAIQSVKRELTEAYTRDKDGPGFRETQARLLNLALSLDVDGAIKALDVSGGSLAA